MVRKIYVYHQKKAQLNILRLIIVIEEDWLIKIGLGRASLRKHSIVQKECVKETEIRQT